MTGPLRLKTTGDGSHTIYVPGIDEHYHSTFGAITESMHIFIQSGLNILTDLGIVSVFEVGFGTGLNALLTCMAASKKNLKIVYHAIEKYPINQNLIHELNYNDVLQGSGLPENTFQALHQIPWGTQTFVSPGFILHKIKTDFITFYPDFNYDVVYFDAFAPDKQPEMWSKENFNKIFKWLNPGGILVTYCVKGQVKRSMLEAGFQVETLPGPPGKREILRARKGKE